MNKENNLIQFVNHHSSINLGRALLVNMFGTAVVIKAWIERQISNIASPSAQTRDAGDDLHYELWAPSPTFT